jgi:FkbM family methyltransferase
MNLELVKKYFTPSSILDIGAHVGEFYSLAKSVFPDAKIISVEAEPSCSTELLNVNPNSIIALLAKDNAIYNWYKTTENSICTGNSIYREISDHFSNEKLIIEKRIGVKLSDLFKPNQFDLIKLDTQGSELDIIQGGLDICKAAKGIIIETSINKYNDGAPLYVQVVVFMHSIGFEQKEEIDIFHYGDIFQKDILFIRKGLNS